MDNETRRRVRAGQRPPGLIRLERGLGLPVPFPWRPWAAEMILSDEWAQRRLTRVRWVRAHRVQTLGGIVLFEAAVAAAVIIGIGFIPVIDCLFIAPVMFGVRMWTKRRPPDDLQLYMRRSQILSWNGLRPDGSLEPAPDRLLTLAALPPWAIAALASIELGLIMSGVVGLVWVFGLAIARV